jgi:hypothetical protein
VISEDAAGMRAQAQGLAEAAGLAFETRLLHARGLWRHLPPRWWPWPLAAAAATPPLTPPWPALAIGCGSKAAAVLAALAPHTRVVMVQHPRMAAHRFDLVVVARHDHLTGPNVLVSRTALHRATPARLAAEAGIWRPRFATLPRPLVAVLVGGSNHRYRLDAAVATGLARQLTTMMAADGVSVALTPSRRTDAAAREILCREVAAAGGWVWDMQGENPYFGMLALADAIVVTEDSVSMVSEAVATAVPVLLARLPGRSRRIGEFTSGLIADGRLRPFRGRFESWPVTPIDDTPFIAAEMCRRLGYPAPAA